MEVSERGYAGDLDIYFIAVSGDMGPMPLKSLLLIKILVQIWSGLRHNLV